MSYIANITVSTFIRQPHLQICAGIHGYPPKSVELSPRSAQNSRIVFCALQNSQISRRGFISLAVMSLATIPSYTLARGPPQKTILDEEKELNEKMSREAEEKRKDGLRAGFEAVEKASFQLDDLRQFAEEQNWDGVRSFSRYFNNAVERKGMEPIAKKLRDKKDREGALAICKQVTEALKQVDHAAMSKDRQGALAHVHETQSIIAKFQTFKP